MQDYSRTLPAEELEVTLLDAFILSEGRRRGCWNRQGTVRLFDEAGAKMPLTENTDGGTLYSIVII